MLFMQTKPPQLAGLSSSEQAPASVFHPLYFVWKKNVDFRKHLKLDPQNMGHVVHIGHVAIQMNEKPSTPKNLTLILVKFNEYYKYVLSSVAWNRDTK